MSVLFWLLSFFAVGEESVIKNTLSEKSVQLSQDLIQILKRWDPEFSVFSIKDYPTSVVSLFDDSSQELPMAVIADFNGDQKNDLALMGRNQQQEVVVILIRTKDSYATVEVRRRPLVLPKDSYIESPEAGRETGLPEYLSLLPTKDLMFSKNKTHKEKPNALQLEYYNGKAKAYYVKRNYKNQFELVEYTGMIK